ncbi:Myristoyl-CoA:protein N-myristoyltransferase, N-terminal domain-containing protein [Mycena filopes]|nr:Myristoyl-CoA:protein N-myristoyltransferase, N-terminal domain-containing protein [Mycena filopes]
MDRPTAVATIVGIVEQDAAVPSTSQKKKKKKKSKAAKALAAIRGRSEIPQELVDHVLDKVKADGAAGSDEANEDNVRQALEQMKIMDVVKGKAGLGGHNQKDMGAHKFWATQPVPQLGEGPPLDDGYIEASKPREEVRQEPYPLPKDFEWSTLDINDPKQNEEVYNLLSLNYVEDEDASFRFQYSSEFLQWALKPPGYFKEWHVGVRVSSNKKLVAFISGVPITLRVRGKVFTASEINYLCVHKKLRSKRLAPVLIKEVTRQPELLFLHRSLSVRYYHRALNIPKLLEVGFTFVPRNMTAARMIRINKVPDTPTLNVRPMEERDVVPLADLFTKYMRRFDMAPIMSLEDVRHQFLSGQGGGNIGDGGEGRKVGQVTWTYVVENPDTHKITDFFSIYYLPSTIIHSPNPKYGTLEAGYLYYYATDVAFEDGAEEDGRLKQRLQTLIGDALVIANQAKLDVFNALTLMDNVPILKDLRFGVGDGFLNFYLRDLRSSDRPLQTTADSCNTLLETAISIEGKGTPCKLFVDHTCDSIDPVLGTVTFKNGVTLTADLIVDSGGARRIAPTTENPNQPCVNNRLCLLNDASHANEDAVALEVIFSDKQNFTRNVKDGLGLYKTVSKARQVTPVDKEASETFDLSDVYMRVTQEVSRLKARNNTHLSLLANRLNNDRIMFAMRI